MHFYGKTITLTFGDQAENHVGMEKIGNLAPNGFNLNELRLAKKLFEDDGYRAQIIDLTKMIKDHQDVPEKAYILIVSGGINCILMKIKKTSDDLFIEQSNLNVDKKAKMHGKVVQKHARHNLCFADRSQNPDYDKGKGRIVSFSHKSIKLTNVLRKSLGYYLGFKAANLYAEGNYYYNYAKCGIGYHGDGERRIVIGVRLGETLPLCYQWYKNDERIGPRKKLLLRSGDIYVMSEKAVGTDWKTKSKLTLRHAAGANKYIE